MPSRCRSGRWPSGLVSRPRRSICTSTTRTRCWMRSVRATSRSSTRRCSGPQPGRPPPWRCCVRRAGPTSASRIETPQLYRIATMGESKAGSDIDAAVASSAFTHMRASVQALMDEGIYAPGDATDVALELWTAAHGVAALMIAKPHLPFGRGRGVHRPGDGCAVLWSDHPGPRTRPTRRRRRLLGGCSRGLREGHRDDGPDTRSPILRADVDGDVRARTASCCVELRTENLAGLTGPRARGRRGHRDQLRVLPRHRRGGRRGGTRTAPAARSRPRPPRRRPCRSR